MRSRRDAVDRANLRVMVVCAVGWGLSLYAYHVETQKHLDADYEALCDLSDRMSCSRVLASEYGKRMGALLPEGYRLLDLPNCLFGAIFYGLLPLTTAVNSRLLSRLVLFLTVLANLLSVYFAYILFLVLKDFCIICVSTYVVNVLLYKAVKAKHKLLHGS